MGHSLENFNTQPQNIVVELPGITKSRFTMLDNPILEALPLAGLTSRQHDIIWVVIRQTLGYQKAADIISISQFAARTGMDESAVCKTIKQLVDKHLLLKRQGGLSNRQGVQAYNYELNTNITEWTTPVKMTGGPVKITNTPPVKMTGTKERTAKEKKHTTARVSDSPIADDPRGRTATQLQHDGFLAFWKTYPKHEAKQAALKAWNKQPISYKHYDHILRSVGVHAKTDAWQKEAGRFVPNPATYLNQGRYDDEIKPTAQQPGLVY